ncbi:hypothetical protein O181_064094 [Austropuccinia psidii MF-1]|uniref:Uncharacterized protein n=1 Tax=Austropuccinia psidii MF-1 TaxID=1389203 RepID=A0A9Q3I370_9BASI|nr:hypothetical protein [Austropuccinia psidii MF-1]
MPAKGQVKKIKAWLKNQSIPSEDQKKQLAQKKEKSPVEAPQASKSAKCSQASPKVKLEGKEKGQVRGQVQVEQALPSELQNFKARKDSHGKCVQYGKSFDGV